MFTVSNKFFELSGTGTKFLVTKEHFDIDIQNTIDNISITVLNDVLQLNNINM